MAGKIWFNGIEGVKKWLAILLEKILPYKDYRYLLYLYQRMMSKETSRSYEEAYFFRWRPFSKKNYYIVRMEYPGYAHFAAAEKCIFVCEYLKQKGMNPIIDLEWRHDFEKGILNGENRWGDVFQQKEIEDVIREKATIFVGTIDEARNLFLPETCRIINGNSSDSFLHAKGNDWRNYYKTIYMYVKEYWHFNSLIMKNVKREEEILFKDNEKVLGVALREDFSEEFYKLLKSEDAKVIFKRHPMGLGVNEIIGIVAEREKEWNFDKIFVATMYNETIGKFEAAFPGKVVYCDRERLNMMETIDQINSRSKYMDESFGKGEHREKLCKRGKQYARETILLSKCSYLIGMKSGQTIAALSMNGGCYLDIKILEDKNHIERY